MASYREHLHSPPFGGVMFVAMSLAMRYTRTTPTAEQLQKELGCSRATAYRWFAAIRDAKGER